jgi:hypothetical protein
MQPDDGLEKLTKKFTNTEIRNLRDRAFFFRDCLLQLATTNRCGYTEDVPVYSQTISNGRPIKAPDESRGKLAHSRQAEFSFAVV